MQHFLRGILKLPGVSILSSALNEFLDIQRVLSAVPSIYDCPGPQQAYGTHIERGGRRIFGTQNPRDSLDTSSFALAFNDALGATGDSSDEGDDDDDC